MTVAVIADIVGSRRLDDREGAQRAIATVVEAVQKDLPVATAPLTAVVGDELQGEFSRLGDALASILLIRLALPEGVDCRFGVGIGEVRPLQLDDRRIPEGPAWWAAREAVEHVARAQHRAAPYARTWIRTGEGEDAVMSDIAGMANAYLLVRDQLIGQMSERTRRLTYGRCVGRSQRELAEAEGISQSAVSQALASAGASSIVDGLSSIVGTGRR